MKIKVCLSLILFTVILSIVCCKKSDKDSNENPIVKESKAFLLRKTGERLMDNDSFNQAIQVLYKSLSLTDSNINKGICYNNIGYCLTENQDFEGALKLYLKAYSIFKEKNDLTLLAQAQMNAANTLKIIGVFDIASIYALEAKSIFEKDTGLLRELGIAYNMLGNLNREIGNFDQAIEYHKKAYQIRLKKLNQEGMAASINNIGNVYFDKKQYDSAIFYFIKYRDSSQRINNFKKLGRAYENLAKTYLAKTDLITAQKNIDSSWFYYSKIDNKPGFLSLYLIKSDFYKSSDNSLALEYALNALQISQKLHFVKEKSEALKKLGSIYAQQGKYTQAYSAINAIQLLKDSILDKEKIARIYANVFRIETDESKKQLEEVQHLRQKRTYQRNTAIIGLVLLLFILILLIRKYKDKLRFNRILSNNNLLLKRQNQSLEQTRIDLEKENYYISKKIAAFQMNEGVYLFDQIGPILYKDIIKLDKKKEKALKNDTYIWFYNRLKNTIESRREDDKSLKHFENALPDFLFARISQDCIINLNRISKDKNFTKWEFYFNENSKAGIVKITITRPYYNEFNRRFQKFTDLFN